MSSLQKVVDQADKEMQEFLNAGQGSGTPTEGGTPAEITVDESHFYAEDEDEDGIVPGQPTTSAPTTSIEQPGQQPSAPQMFTREQLEYERELAEARGRNAAYNEFVRSGMQQPAVTQPEQPPQPSYFSDDEISFTEDEEQGFSPETRAFAQKIAKRALSEFATKVITPLQLKIEEQSQQIQSYGQGVANTNAQVLYAQIHQQVPDLPNIVASKEWVEFLDSPSPVDSSVPIRHIFSYHLQKGRQRDILNIVNMFRQQNPGAQVQLQQQASPGQSSVGTPPTTIPERKPKMFSNAKYLEAVEKWQRGIMPYKEFAKIQELYDKAFAEGRIKY